MEQKKRIISNTMYTIGGALLMNGVLQLGIYPLLNRHLGSDALGVLLYIMGLAAILCPSVGQALNTSRLVVRRDHEVSNGDYNRLILLFSGVGSVIVLIILGVTGNSASTLLGGALTVILLITTSFRFYGDVEYRLNLNYKRYFCYYAILSVGYIFGYGLFLVTGNWFCIFLTGEILALGFLKITGTVFRDFFLPSKYFSVAFSRGSFLIFSYLVTNLTLNIDRVALKNLVGDLAVTQYYVTSLIGKTLLMLVAPVNTIIISYLTRRKENLNRRQFLVFTGLGLGVAGVFFLFAQIATPIFVRLFYGDLYQSVKSMITVVNITQILGLLSAYLFIVVLTFTEEKWQFVLQIIHLVTMVALVLIFTGNRGIMGFAMAALIANAIRVLAVIVLGLWKVQAGKEGE